MLNTIEAMSLQASVARQKVAGTRDVARFVLSGMLAGAYIGFAVVLMVSTAGPLFAAGDGAAKLVSGLVFGVALTLVVFAGADLVTSAMMVLTQGVLMGAVTARAALAVMCATFATNLLGSVAFAGIVVVSGVLRSNAAAGQMVSAMLAAKAEEGPVELISRGILCNVLVCLAIWMSARVHSESAKLIIIYAALMAFISSGFEHVVANMTTYAIGLFSGDPHASPGLYASNLAWVGLGNLVGGSLIVGAGYWLVSGRPRIS